MSVTVTVGVNGVRVPLVLDDDALETIRRAVAPDDRDVRWPEWMSAETAARYLDVTVERLRKLKERRAIPYAQEGPRCRVFFCRSDLDEWMARSRADGRCA